MLDMFKRTRPTGLVAAAAAVPFLLITALVVKYAVNVPYWDEWEFALVIKAYNEGTLSLADLYAEHNEHRIPIPSLVFLLVALISHWDTRLLMYLSLVVAASTFGLLFALLRRTITGSTPLLLTALLVSGLFFSPVQWENWLWGFQLAWFMNVGGLVLAVWALSRPGRPDRAPVAWRQTVIAIAGATVATFSLASGLMVWIVCLPLFVFNARLRRWLLLWIPVAVAEAVAYFINWNPPASNGGIGTILEHPRQFVTYLAVFLSRPLLPYLHVNAALLTAGFLLVMLLAASAYTLLRHRKEFPPILPWLCLAAYAVVAGASSASGRLAYGNIGAFPSRYTTIALLLVVATCVVLARALQLLWSSADRTAIVRAARYVPAMALVLVVALYAYSFAPAVSEMQRLRDSRTSIAVCTRTVTSADDGCLLGLYPSKAKVFGRIQYLRSIGWL